MRVMSGQVGTDQRFSNDCREVLWRANRFENRLTEAPQLIRLMQHAVLRHPTHSFSSGTPGELGTASK